VKNITSVIGIVLEVKNGKAYLIHKSARDFLLKNGQLRAAEFCESLHPSIYLAKVCMANTHCRTMPRIIGIAIFLAMTMSVRFPALFADWLSQAPEFCWRGLKQLEFLNS
jgi:hypothetical protein